MNVHEERKFIQRQIIETESLAAGVADHPLMGPQMEYRAKALRERLSALPAETSEARASVFFFGRPVEGARAIEAEFAAKALEPFLDMVKTEFASTNHGPVGQRGPRKGEDNARLMLVGTPRGSFGFELEAPRTEDLFAEQALADVLQRLTKTFDSAGTSDADYLDLRGELSERSFPHLRKFFDVLESNGAGLRVQTGELEIEMPPVRVAQASRRISDSTAETKDREIPGRFRGATLETWRFNFRSDDDSAFSGKISHELNEDDVIEMIGKLNQPAVANIEETTITTGNGAMRRTYLLKGLQ